jgi:hypothetical protein
MFLMELGSKASAALTAAKAALAASQSIPVAVRAVLNANGSWNPVMNGKAILTPPLRQKLADAFGHLAFNIHRAENGQEPL